MSHFKRGRCFQGQDTNGDAHTIVTWVEYVDMGEGHAHANWVPSGFESLRTEDGRPVRDRGDGRYDIENK